MRIDDMPANASPVVSGVGHIFVPSDDYVLRVVDQKTQKFLTGTTEAFSLDCCWLASNISLTRDFVFVPAQRQTDPDHSVFLTKSIVAKLQWPDPPQGAGPWFTAPAIVASDTGSPSTVYLAVPGDPGISAYTVTGTLLWKATVGGTKNTPIASSQLIGTYVYAGGVALDPATGEQKWERSDIEFQAMALDARHVYGRCGPEVSVCAVNPTNGNLIWSAVSQRLPIRQGDYQGLSYLAVDPDHQRVFVSKRTRLCALSTTDGTSLWCWSPPGQDVGGYITAANGVLFLAGRSGTVYALDEAEGGSGPLWHYTLPDGAAWSDAVIANGLVFIVSHGGTLYAFGPRGG